MNYSQLLSTIDIVNLKPWEIDQSQSNEKRIDYDWSFFLQLMI